MENKENRSSNRTLWIVVAVVLVAMCLCVLAITAIGLGVFTLGPVRLDGGLAMQRDVIERSFEVGAAPSLEIDDFAGTVTVRAGGPGTIQVVATRRASNRSRLEQIQVDMTEQGGGLLIKAQKPAGFGNASVDLEISAPPDSRLTVRTGAGNVDVQSVAGPVTANSGAGNIEIEGVPGEIEVHTGAGNVRVVGAAGPVRLNTGVGNIDYDGVPKGECRFESGVGNIQLRMPAGVNVRVDLTTGVGNIGLDFDVTGQNTKREVRGVIGSGDQGQVFAHTGTGDIDLRR